MSKQARRATDERLREEANNMSALLPPEFSQLEHLVGEWAIEDGHER